MQLYRPSIVATSIVVCARVITKIVPTWNAKIKELTNYDYNSVEDRVQPCFEILYSLYNESIKKVQNENTPITFNKKSLTST
jgi:Cyclin, C-terminal domain